MTMIATDIETYKQYTGTSESYNDILNMSPTQNELPCKRKMKKGWWYPVLNSQEFTIGVIQVQGKKAQVFHNAEDHYQELLRIIKKDIKNRRKPIVYGHNHSYDFYGYAQKHLFTNEWKIIVNKPFLAVHLETGTMLSDSRWFYPTTLKEVGRIIKSPKMEMPLCVKNPDELIDYCIQDVHITLEAILQLKKNFKEVGFSTTRFLTGAGVAKTTFFSYCRKNNIHWSFMKSGIVYRSPNWRKTRVALRGGRCEAFQTGNFENTTLVDINNCYGKAMSEMEFPNFKEFIFLKKPKLEDWAIISKCIGVMQCTIEKTDDGKLPYLPVSYKFEGDKRHRQIYPKYGKLR